MFVMHNKQRLAAVLSLGLAITLLFMFVGLPFGQLGWNSVKAQYGPGSGPVQLCGGSVKLMLVTANTTFYADEAMTEPIGTLVTTGAKANQKYFACVSTLDGKASAALFLTPINPLIFVSESVLSPVTNP
jgi:hypothetical protein